MNVRHAIEQLEQLAEIHGDDVLMESVAGRSISHFEFVVLGPHASGIVVVMTG